MMFNKRYKQLTLRSKTDHNFNYKLSALDDSCDMQNLKPASKFFSKSQISLVAVDVSGAGFSKMSSFCQSSKNCDIGKRTLSLDRKRGLHSASQTPDNMIHQLKAFEHKKKLRRGRHMNYSFNDLHSSGYREDGSFTQCFAQIDHKLDNPVEFTKANNESLLLRLLPCRRSKSVPANVKMSEAKRNSTSFEEADKEKSVSLSGCSKANSLFSLRSLEASLTSSRTSSRLTLSKKLRSFVSTTFHPRPKSLDYDSLDIANSNQTASNDGGLASTHSITSTLARQCSPSMGDGISVSACVDSNVGPGTYYYFSSSTMPITQARKYDFPWESLPKDWTTAVKLREISQRRKDEHGSSSGNWSGGSNRQSSESAQSSACNSQRSVGLDSGRGSLIDKEVSLVKDRSNAKKRFSTFMPPDASCDNGTEQWLSSLAMPFTDRKDKSRSMESLVKLSELTRQNIQALEDTFLPTPIRPLRLADEEALSVHSVDQEGFYTSFHNDSGLRRSVGILLDEDFKMLCSNEEKQCPSMNSSDATIIAAPCQDGNAHHPLVNGTGRTRPLPFVRSDSKLLDAFSKAPVIMTQKSEPFVNCSICEKNSCIVTCTSDDEWASSGWKSPSTFDHLDVPSWCAISDEDITDCVCAIQSCNAAISVDCASPFGDVHAAGMTSDGLHGIVSGVQSFQEDDHQKPKCTTCVSMTPTLHHPSLKNSESRFSSLFGIFPISCNKDEIYMDQEQATGSWSSSIPVRVSGILSANATSHVTVSLCTSQSLLPSLNNGGGTTIRTPITYHNRSEVLAQTGVSADFSKVVSRPPRLSNFKAEPQFRSVCAAEPILTSTVPRSDLVLPGDLPVDRALLQCSSHSASGAVSSMQPPPSFDFGHGGCGDGSSGFHVLSTTNDSSLVLSEVASSLTYVSMSNSSTPTNSTFHIDDDAELNVQSTLWREGTLSRCHSAAGVRGSSVLASSSAISDSPLPPLPPRCRRHRCTALSAAVDSSQKGHCDVGTGVFSRSICQPLISLALPYDGHASSAELQNRANAIVQYDEHVISECGVRGKRRGEGFSLHAETSSPLPHGLPLSNALKHPISCTALRSDSYRVATGDGADMTSGQPEWKLISGLSQMTPSYDFSLKHDNSLQHTVSSANQLQDTCCLSNALLDSVHTRTQRADSYRLAVRQGPGENVRARSVSCRNATIDDDLVHRHRFSEPAACAQGSMPVKLAERTIGMAGTDQLSSRDRNSSVPNLSSPSGTVDDGKSLTKSFSGISCLQRRMKPDLHDLLMGQKSAPAEAKRRSKSGKNSMSKLKNRSSTYIRFDPIFEHVDDTHSSTDTLIADRLQVDSGIITVDNGSTMNDRVVRKLALSKVSDHAICETSTEYRPSMSILSNIKSTIKSISGRNISKSKQKCKN